MAIEADDPDPDAWRDRAKCKGLDPDLFVPNGPGGSLNRAVAVCHGWNDGRPCPVRRSCFDAGEDGNEIGVWGGQVRNQNKLRLVVPMEQIVDMRPRRDG